MNTVAIEALDNLFKNISVDMTTLEINKYKNNWRDIIEVRNFLKSQKSFSINDELETGGFGGVYTLDEIEYNGQVLKVTSLRQYLRKHQIWQKNKEDKYIPQSVCNKYLQKFLNEGYTHIQINGIHSFPQTYDVFGMMLVQTNNIIDVLLCIRMKQYENVIYKKLNEVNMLKLVKDVLLCLKQAHNLGFVNRDISNENIMYDSGKKSYILIDWGTTKVLQQSTTSSVGCKDKYVAPERLSKADNLDAERDPRTDIYSLGVLLYYWANKCSLNDKKPSYRVLVPNYEKLRAVSAAYLLIMKRALNKDPGKRFQTAEEMMQAINGAIDKLMENENSKADKKVQNPIEKKKQFEKPPKKVTKVCRMMTVITYSILGIIVLVFFGLVVKNFVVDPVVAGIRISNEGSIETFINEFQLQVNNKDVDEHFKYMTFYDKEEGYFDSDYLNEIIEGSFSIKEEKSDILLRINDRTTTPAYPAQDKTDDTFGTLTNGKEVTVEILSDAKITEVDAYSLENGKVYLEMMSFLNGMGFITNNPNNNTFNIITESFSDDKENNTIIENKKETI